MSSPIARIHLSLTPNGRRLVIAEADELRVLDLGAAAAGRDRPQLAVPSRALALAAFDDELWVVEAADDGHQLRRFDLRLDELGAHALPPGARFVRLPGRHAALWLGAGAFTVVEADGAIVATRLDVPDGHRVVAALSPRQWLVEGGGGVALVDQGRPRWRVPLDPGHAVLAMAPIFDGRSVVALVGEAAAEVGAERRLVVLSTRDGGVQHSLAVHDIAGASFAAHRGLAVLRRPRELVLVDLRFGRVLGVAGVAGVDDDVLAATIDDAGQHVVCALREDGVSAFLVQDLLARSERAAAEPMPREPTASSAGARKLVDTGPPSDAPRKVPAALTAAPLHRLSPRSAAAPCATSRAHHELLHDVARRRAALAIARAWDRQSLSRDAPDDLPCERRVDALVEPVGGVAVARVGAAVVALQRAVAALGPAGPGMLGALGDEHGLSRVERDVLLVIAAADLWHDVSELYRVLGHDERRAVCDERLVCELLPDLPAHDVLDALDRAAPLLARGLVARGGGPRADAALSADPLVIRALRGAALDRELERGVERGEPRRSLDELRVPREALARLFAALATPGAPARVALRGREGSGRRTVAAALAALAGRVLGVVDVGLLHREDRLPELAVLLRRAALRGWLPLVDGVDAIPAEHVAARSELRELLEHHDGPVLVRLARDAQPPLATGHLLLDLPPLSTAERAAHWTDAARARGLSLRDADALAARYAIGPGTVERVVAELAAEPRISTDADADAAVHDAVRRHLASRLGAVATRIERLPAWSQVVLPPDIEDSLIELMGRIRHRRAVFDDWGLDKVMSTSRGLTALFQGGPGTGKTLVAGAIARDLGLDLYRVDLSRVVSKWIGETEQNLARVFDAAEEAQAILLFDEADSLFTRRTEVRTSTDRYANQEVNYLLQRLDSFEGIAILTTNAGSAIDPAFRRRMSFRLTFPFPDDEAREALWRVHLPDSIPRAGDLDLADLARRFRMSGGFIRNAALRACFLAADEGSGLAQAHLERAVRSEFREIGKLGETGTLE